MHDEITLNDLKELRKILAGHKGPTWRLVVERCEAEQMLNETLGADGIVKLRKRGSAVIEGFTVHWK